MFTGVAGFENGIQRAHDNKLQSSKTEEGVQNEGRDRNTNEQRQGVLSSDDTPLCIGVSEIDKYSSQLLADKFKGVKNYGDATKINAEELPDFDVLVGGFPCQAFSIAGKRRGFEDTRGTLFYDIARIVKVKQPRLLLLENVKGLLNHDGGKTFTQILSTLDELGYDVEWQVLNSKHFGVPQNRERVFIKGCLRGTGGRKIFPIFGTGGKNYERVGEGTSYCLDSNYYKGTNTLKKGRRQLVEDAGIRRLTPTECERLQGFPDGWTEGFSDTQRYKMMGNAVTVNVIEAIFTKILEVYEND